MRAMLSGLLLCVVVGVLTGCGGGGSSPGTGTTTPSPAAAHVSGVVATGAPVALAQVTITDANGAVKTGSTDANGSYSIDVSGMSFPLLAKVAYTSASGSVTVLYSYAKAPGTVNVNPITNAAVVASTGSFDGNFTPAAQTAIGSKLDAKVAQFQSLLAQFGAGSVNPVTGVYTFGSGLDSVFDILDLQVNDATGTLTVKTKFNGVTVATGSLSNIASLAIPASAIPMVDNTSVHISALSAASGEVGSHLLVTVSGINTTDMTKNHVLVGGVWIAPTISADHTALEVWMPPGCKGGSVAVLTVNGQGQALMGTTTDRYTVTTQHDYAIGMVLLTNTSFHFWGAFPASGNVNVRFTQGATVVNVPTTSTAQGLVVTIPAAINVLNPCTIQVTSTDGSKTSNLYSYTP